MVKLKDTDYFKNPTLLFRLIEERQWRDVMEQNIQNEDEAKQWVVKRDKDSGSITWRRLPIHEACIRQPTEEVMLSLLESFPEGARASDTYGRLPLHHACVHGAQENVIHHLLMTYPDSIEVKDVWGKTPLAAAQATLCGNKNQILELLQKRPSYYAVKNVEKEQKRLLDEQAEKINKSMQVERDEYEKVIERLQGQLKRAIVEKCQLSENAKESENMVNDLQSKTEENEKQIKHFEAIKVCLEGDVERHQSKYELLQQTTEKDLNAQKEAYDTMHEQFNKSKCEVSTLQEKLEQKCTEVTSLLDSEANLIATVEEQNDKINEEEKKHEIDVMKLDEMCTGYSAKLIMLEQSVKGFSQNFLIFNDDLSEALIQCELSIKENEMSLFDNVSNLEIKVNGLEESRSRLEEQLSELNLVKVELDSSIVEKSSIIEILQQSIADVKSNYKVLNEEKKIVETSLKEISSELESLQQSHTTLESDTSCKIGNKEKLLHMYTEKIKTLTETIKQSESDISSLKDNLEQRTNELDDLSKQLKVETTENKNLKESIETITARASSLEEKVIHSNGFFTSLDTKFSTMVENQDELLYAASQHENANASSSSSSNKENNSKYQNAHLRSVSEEHERILTSVKQQKVILQSIRSQKLALKMAAAEAMMNEKKNGYVFAK